MKVEISKMVIFLVPSIYDFALPFDRFDDPRVYDHFSFFGFVLVLINLIIKCQRQFPNQSMHFSLLWHKEKTDYELFL